MKRLIVLSLVLLLGVTGFAKTNYFDNIYVGGTTTLTGAMTFTGAASFASTISVAGNFTLAAKVIQGGEWGATAIVLNGTDPDQVSQIHGLISGTDVAAGAYSSTYSTNTVTADQANNVSVFGTWNELYITGDLDLDGSSNYGADWAVLELADAGGALNGPSGVSWLAAQVGSVTSPDGFVNNSYMAGFIADSNLTTGYTENGVTAAFLTRKGAGLLAWPYGLYLNASSVAIDISLQNGETISNAVDGDVTVSGDLGCTVPGSYDALLGSVEVDVNAVATTALYTVPTGSSCIVTRIVIRSANKSLDQGTDATSNIGFDAATDLVASADISKVLVGTTTWDLLTLATPGVMGTTTQVLNWHNTTGCTTADSTLQVDVFGYLF